MGRQDVTGSWSVAPTLPEAARRTPTRGPSTRRTATAAGARSSSRHAERHAGGLAPGGAAAAARRARPAAHAARGERHRQEVEVQEGRAGVGRYRGRQDVRRLPSTYEPGLDGSFTLVVASADDDAFTFGPHAAAGASFARALDAGGAGDADAVPAGRRAAAAQGGAGVAGGAAWAGAELEGRQVRRPRVRARPQDQQKKGKALYMSGQAPRDAKKSTTGRGSRR